MFDFQQKVPEPSWVNGAVMVALTGLHAPAALVAVGPGVLVRVAVGSTGVLVRVAVGPLGVLGAAWLLRRKRKFA